MNRAIAAIIHSLPFLAGIGGLFLIRLIVERI